jgi:hypothetical protein
MAATLRVEGGGEFDWEGASVQPKLIKPVSVIPREWADGYAEELLGFYVVKANELTRTILGELLSQRITIPYNDLITRISFRLGCEVDTKFMGRINRARKRIDVVLSGLINIEGKGRGRTIGINLEKLAEYALDEEDEEEAVYHARDLAKRRQFSLRSQRIRTFVSRMRQEYNLEDIEVNILNLLANVSWRGVSVNDYKKMWLIALRKKLPDGYVVIIDGQYYLGDMLYDEIGYASLRIEHYEIPDGPYPLPILNAIREVSDEVAEVLEVVEEGANEESEGGDVEDLLEVDEPDIVAEEVEVDEGAQVEQELEIEPPPSPRVYEEVEYEPRTNFSSYEWALGYAYVLLEKFGKKSPKAPLVETLAELLMFIPEEWSIWTMAQKSTRSYDGIKTQMVNLKKIFKGFIKGKGKRAEIDKSKIVLLSLTAEEQVRAAAKAIQLHQEAWNDNAHEIAHELLSFDIDEDLELDDDYDDGVDAVLEKLFVEIMKTGEIGYLPKGFERSDSVCLRDIVGKNIRNQGRWLFASNAVLYRVNRFFEPTDFDFSDGNPFELPFFESLPDLSLGEISQARVEIIFDILDSSFSYSAPKDDPEHEKAMAHLDPYGTYYLEPRKEAGFLALDRVPVRFIPPPNGVDYGELANELGLKNGKVAVEWVDGGGNTRKSIVFWGKLLTAEEWDAYRAANVVKDKNEDEES